MTSIPRARAIPQIAYRKDLSSAIGDMTDVDDVRFRSDVRLDPAGEIIEARGGTGNVMCFKTTPSRRSRFCQVVIMRG
jgi:hypothetical protein